MPRYRSGFSSLAVVIGLGGVLAAVVPVSGGLVSLQEASPAAPAVVTPVEVPAIVSAYVDALNAHDPARVAALYAEDAVVSQAVRDGNTFRGRAEIEGWVADNLGGVPDLTVTTEAVIAEGERIAWAWVYTGAYTGRYPGLPAGEGQPIRLRGVSLLELRDGAIVQETVYYDNRTFLAEVDAPPATPTSDATPAPVG